MLSKILFVVDLSERTSALIPVMHQILNISTHEAILLHVIRTESSRLMPNADNDDKNRAEKRLEQVRNELESGGNFQISPVLIQGNPWIEIVNIASRENVSCIVMGSHIGEEITKLTLGDITENVLHNAQKSLLIIRECSPDSGQIYNYSLPDTRIFRNILYATDFSPDAKKCIPYIESVLNYDTKNLIIAHIQDMRNLRYATPEMMAQFNIIDQKRLEELRDHFKTSADISVEIILKTGNAIEELLKITREHEISLAVFGEKGKTNVREMMLGGVVETIVHRTPVHIFIAR